MVAEEFYLYMNDKLWQLDGVKEIILKNNKYYEK